MEYESLEDAELVKLCKENCEKAEVELIKRYGKMVEITARPYFLIGGENKDLVQEGMIGLVKSIRDYDKKKGASFSTFAKMCILRQVLTAIRRENSQKYKVLNNSYSLNITNKNKLEYNDTENIELLESKIQTPEEQYISRETITYIKKTMDNELTTLEKKVMTYYLEGKTYSEMSNILNKDVKAIDNALQRLRNKLQKKIK